MKSRGFLIFAHNNDMIDYGLVALINALMIKSNLRENAVALVTDEGTISWLRQNHASLVEKAFDHVIVVPWDKVDPSGERRYQDTLSTSHILPWRNGTRLDAYDLTPFDETIVIDADYLVMDKTLDAVWSLDTDVALNREAVTLEHKQPAAAERFLSPFTATMYWATCMFFRKSELAESFFALARNVRTHYKFHGYLYNFPVKIFRNDYAFSVAAHVLNGQYASSIITSLPSPKILTSFDRDDIVDVPGKNEITFLANDTENEWRNRVTRVTGVNVHVMNKFAIVRHADRLLEIYG